MNRTIVAVFSLGCLLAFGVGTVRAGLINFDDLPGNGSAIPSGYYGLNWSNLTVINAVKSGSVFASAPNVAFASGGSVTIAPASSKPFTFVGADFSAWFNPVVVTATGFRSGSPVYNASFTLRENTLSLETLDFRNIDALEFTALPSDGSPGLHGEGSGFIIDNFTTGPQKAPEPASWLLFGVGAAGAGLAALRRRRLNPVRIPGAAGP